jgi:Delta7-sterol 5-desaturase
MDVIAGLLEGMAEQIRAFRTLPFSEVVIRTLLLNVTIFVLTLAAGEALIRLFRTRAVTDPPPPITRLECLLALCTVLANSLVLVVGALLWRAGWITVRFELSLYLFVRDTLVLFLAMDAAMYFLHRFAHWPPLYRILHQIHHLYDNPRPLTLFALNPLEGLAFGVLWLFVLMLYPATWHGIMAYLGLNVLFGLIGHLGVEPFPRCWVRLPIIGLVSTSTFHAEHHEDGAYNFGFYTLIWDRLFGTLSPEYQRDFERATGK